jgi:kinesin family protein 5
LQQGTFSEKDEQMRQIVAKLDAIESDPEASSLTAEEATQIRRQLAEGQSLVRETVEQDENDLIMRRKDELESRLSALETEYEELLGTCHRFCFMILTHSSFRENHS